MTRLLLATAIAATLQGANPEDLMRAGRYADPVRAWDEVLRTLPADAPSRRDLENRRALYAALVDVPPQGVKISGRSMSLARNRLGTWDAAVDVGGRVRQWIFDTGANLSTLTQSEADALGLKTRETGAIVHGSTGASNPVRIAVAPEVRVGPARLTNVVFLVVSDAALYIPPLDVQIRGILGMPVLRALDAFSVAADGEVRFEFVSNHGAPLTFDGWSAIVDSAHAGRPLRLLLDTGANVSSLYPSARAAFSEFERASWTQKQEQAGGAGALVTRTTSAIPTLRLTLGSAEIALRNVSVLPQAPEDESQSLPRDGVLGMDALGKGFAIDFRAMRLRVF